MEHSFCDATHHVVCSALITVPAAVMVKTLKNIESIKRYGVDGGLIRRCVVENLIPPTEVGAVRRCTLHLPPYADKLVREKLTQYVEHRNQGGDNAHSKEEGVLSSIEMSLDYVPCEEGERHRSPFEPMVEDALRHVRTQIRVFSVTRAPHRCFVEMKAECVLRVHHGCHVSAENKLRDATCRNAVTDFWRSYLDAQLFALEKQVCKEAFPEVETRADGEYRAAFTRHEEVLCDWAANASDTIPRQTVVDELEDILVWWARVLEAYRHQKTLTDLAEALVERVRLPSHALQHSIPRHFIDAEKPLSLSRCTSSDSTKADMVPATKSASELMHTVPYSVDLSPQGSLPRHSFTNAPMYPSTFVRSGSRDPATGVSDLNRPSVVLPPDRRHTAVPKKSIVTTSASPKGGAPAEVMVSASLSLASLNPATMSISNFLQPSAAPHSCRRKPMTVQPPHLLQHAQRRMSNVNSLSNSMSRQSVPSATLVLNKAGESTGAFFSQFFTTPSYISAMVNTPTSTYPPAGMPAQRTLAAIAAGAASSGMSSLVARAPTTTTVPGVSAATQAAPAHNNTAAAPPEVAETFQPEMVRQLFSLTGALQEDVARRIFFSLCSQGGASGPCLTADGLKCVLRHLDLCGLRGGSSLSRGDAAACDAAYRAEVQRCYDEQNACSSSSSKRDAAGNFRDAHSRGRSPSEELSMLSRLTARRAAVLQEGDEVALDKVVQSVLSRFAFQKKRELSYEEFHMALLHLRNN
ncbi:hypothetical protein ABL78_1015 [Leptomonas seymouri]|uniref:Uncharacterized protein n=1 Tax=Leptomonas seymouri TaxID=5684 RepID=A0A0N0P8E3_LEPSE|nr:hypothetical protein ABL78_1015 [Leptomonas seymouri]|eukprot:KPI89846.1 hypothetical protein ABL78_1015 [Leptomonas seymouri]